MKRARKGTRVRRRKPSARPAAAASPRAAGPGAPAPRRPRPVPILEELEATGLPEPLAQKPGPSAVASGGDLDADWQRAEASGEETVGGSVATPDQDVVDEIGHALGVEQALGAPLVTSDDILRARDRHYWHLEREAAAGEERAEREAGETAEGEEGSR